jgi:hypothetical protein
MAALPLPALKNLPFESEMIDGKPAVSPEKARFVAIEILSVYRGSRHNDTCISEIGAVTGNKLTEHSRCFLRHGDGSRQ